MRPSHDILHVFYYITLRAFHGAALRHKGVFPGWVFAEKEIEENTAECISGVYLSNMTFNHENKSCLAGMHVSERMILGNYVIKVSTDVVHTFIYQKSAHLLCKVSSTKLQENIN